MMRTISQILLEDYSIRLRPDAKGACPQCHGHNVSITPGDQLGKCFLPQCGYTLTAAREHDHTHAPVSLFAGATATATLDTLPSAPPLPEATSTPVSLSVLTVLKGSASKQLIAGAGGLPVKGRGSLAISHGIIEHVRVQGLAGLQALLHGIQTNQVLVHGVVTGSLPGETRPVVTTEVLQHAKPDTLEPGTVARSLDYLSYPPDLFVPMFDRDDNPEDPTKLETAADLMALLAPLLPGLAAAGRVVTRSTSSAIKSKTTGAWLTPPSGFHIYFLARGDLPRFVELLKVRLWNAGYGYCRLASPNKQTGVCAVLERAVVDLSVFSPERLDYAAGARISKRAPFYQDRGEPELIPGTVLDLDTFAEVTPAEREDYQQRLAAAKAALAPERFAQVTAHIAQAEPELTPEQVEALARTRLEQSDTGYLPGDFRLYFAHRNKVVQVQDLSAAYDGWRLADPAEPDYRDGGDAIFHWHGGNWLVNSFAHGELKTYRAVPVPPPTPDDEDWDDLTQRVASAPAQDGPPAGLVHHVIPAHLQHHPDPRVRRYWQQLYRRTAQLKYRLFQEGLL
jgi:hypothetical protein